MPAQVRVERDELAAFCKRHNIRLLSFFGSVVRQEYLNPRIREQVLAEAEVQYAKE